MKKATRDDYDWLKADTYEDCKRFDISAWAGCLADREMWLNNLKVHSLDNSPFAVALTRKAEQIHSGQCLGVFLDGENEKLTTYFGLGETAFWNKTHKLNRVRPTSVATMRANSNELSSWSDDHCTAIPKDQLNTYKAVLRGSMDMMGDAGSEFDYPYDFSFLDNYSDYLEGDGAPFGGINISIYLDAPDSVIIEEFSKFLPKYRKALAEKMRKTNPDASVKITKQLFAKMVSYKVLQYADMLIWAAAKKLKLTDDVAAGVLFDIDAKEFNKVQKKHCVKWLSNEFIMNIRAAAEAKN
jgi:hypothetical protein